MLRAILFDFNGVLIDDEPVHFELFRRIFDEEGLQLDEEAYYRDYVGLDDAAGFRFAWEEAGREPDAITLARLCARKAAYYQETLREGSYTFFEGAVELVRDAAAAGLTLGVVSGALRQEIDPALRQEGLAELFKVIVAAEDVERSKPDPEGYRLGLSELNARPPLPERLLHPHEVLAIEDTVAGLEAARAAGLATLGVAHTFPEEVLALADEVVPTLVGLSSSTLARRYQEVSRQ
ncbi:MAG TPA: HAD family phosphatase [Thermoanaerobaculia bacterium]|nr:HAD family phosphatase [Thermoanaerobaculia bacterium]